MGPQANLPDSIWEMLCSDACSEDTTMKTEDVHCPTQQISFLHSMAKAKTKPDPLPIPTASQ